MKNVTKILTVVTLCATLFGSVQRIDALGGNAALWPGDEANITAFPAQVNNHGFVQLSGVGTATEDHDGSVGMIFQKDATTWGFNYGSNDNWVSMMWGDGSMGVAVALESTTGTNEASDMSVSYGNTFDWGEIGVHYATVDNGDGDATLGLNYRTDWGFWLFDNTVASVSDLMADDLALHADFFTHMDAGGADVVYGWGFGYDGGAGTHAVLNTSAWDATANDNVGACTNDGVDHSEEGDAPDCSNAVASTNVVSMNQTATIGVEANMTDWATLRVGYNWSHSLACDNGDVANADGSALVANDDCGENMGGFAWGLGFNWGGLTADFTVDSGLLLDPVGTITGNNDAAGGLTSSAITLTYSF